MRLHVAEPRYISEGISRMSKITQRFFFFISRVVLRVLLQGVRRASQDEIVQGCLYFE
jgi:hypothetical protein